jgi:two-component system response regulator
MAQLYRERRSASAPDLKAILGAAIKSHRSALGVSQEELAYRSDLHRTYISDVERGARNPSVESIEKLARALEISVSALFEHAGNGSETKQAMEILLVENNPREVRRILREFGRASIANPLHVVRDEAEALDFIFATGPYTHRRKARVPQIILFDLNLPKKTGIKVLKQLKANEATRNILVIGLTDSKRDRNIAEHRRLGALTYIVKPVGFQDFIEVTARLSLAWALVKPSRADAGS